MEKQTIHNNRRNISYIRPALVNNYKSLLRVGWILLAVLQFISNTHGLVCIECVHCQTAPVHDMSSSTLHTWTRSIHKSHPILFLYPNCTKARRLSAERRVQRWEEKRKKNLHWSSLVFRRTQEASPFVLLSNSKIIITILITEARLLKIGLGERWCNRCWRRGFRKEEEVGSPCIQTMQPLLQFSVHE